MEDNQFTGSRQTGIESDSGTFTNKQGKALEKKQEKIEKDLHKQNELINSVLIVVQLTAIGVALGFITF